MRKINVFRRGSGSPSESQIVMPGRIAHGRTPELDKAFAPKRIRSEAASHASCPVTAAVLVGSFII